MSNIAFETYDCSAHTTSHPSSGATVAIDGSVSRIIFKHSGAECSLQFDGVQLHAPACPIVANTGVAMTTHPPPGASTEHLVYVDGHGSSILFQDGNAACTISFHGVRIAASCAIVHVPVNIPQQGAGVRIDGGERRIEFEDRAGSTCAIVFKNAKLETSCQMSLVSCIDPTPHRGQTIKRYCVAAARPEPPQGRHADATNTRCHAGKCRQRHTCTCTCKRSKPEM